MSLKNAFVRTSPGLSSRGQSPLQCAQDPCIRRPRQRLMGAHCNVAPHERKKSPLKLSVISFTFTYTKKSSKVFPTEGGKPLRRGAGRWPPSPPGTTPAWE
ncbi:hypothetical protein HOLleu_16901 [Holothuria leucospilota]|uniref:Uncharacterized protein n=1 Tax=Holothuria leucospilota TaxID=206669 RepID=A0A9Q1C6G6_HOLLE|nr:hypothetical protein HOLleu_16901 [Holothuria leucospilota]